MADTRSSSPETSSQAQQEAETSSTGRWVLAATVLGSSIEFIDGTVVNVSIPSLQAAFHATGSQVQWVVETYALFLASLLLIGGSLGDRYGLRRIFLYGVSLFAIASIGCGLAPTIGILLVARSVQGIAGALLVPNSLALLSANFPPEKRGRAIGTWSGFAAIMTALGPVLGGLTVQHASWRWVFFLNVPIALVAAAITFRKIPPTAAVTDAHPPDVIGAVLNTAALSAITFALLQWSAGGTITHLIGLLGVALLGVFLYVERRARYPMMPLDLFKNRTFSGANTLTFFLYAPLAGALFFLPLNLIQIQHYTPTEAGAAMIPMVLLMFVLSRWSGGLLERHGARLPLTVGPLIVAVGYALLARPGIGGLYWTTYFPSMLVLGLGMSISVAPLTTVVMSSVDNARSGAASGVNNAVSQMASLLALAVTAPIFFATFSHSLSSHLRGQVSAATEAQILSDRKRLAAIPTTDPQARAAIDAAFLQGFRLIVLMASASAVAGAATAAFTIRHEG